MNALRQILSPHEHRLQIDLPDEFVGQRLEILIFTLPEPEAAVEGAASADAKLKRLFDKFNVPLPPAYHFDREDAHER